MNSLRMTHWQTPGEFGQRLLNGFAAHKSNYWIGFVTDPLTALFFLFWEAVVLPSNVLVLVAVSTLGLLSWSLLEYAFHRWVYHQGRTLAHAGHKMHHNSPQVLIGMPWFLTTGFLWLVWYLVGYTLQLSYALGFMAGLVTGFNLYGAFHHIHHHFNIKQSWYKKLRVYHKVHHQYPEVNFGVTNPFWDHVFGTTYQAKYGRSIYRTSPERRTTMIAASKAKNIKSKIARLSHSLPQG